MKLLNTITPAQRWGIARVRPSGWRLYFKGGWGSGTGWVDHQVALLTRGDERVSVAILTYRDGSHAYGKETLRGIAHALRGLGSAQSCASRPAATSRTGSRRSAGRAGTCPAPRGRTDAWGS